MHHYTYLLRTSSPEIYYVGMRSSKVSPTYDTSYMGSSKLVNELRGRGVIFSKEILETYETREEAAIAEQRLFDEFNCCNDMNCVNLNSINNPYQPGRASSKMTYFKQLFPVIKPESREIDKFKKINQFDLTFRVKSYNRCWKFINHPEMIRFYYPVNGTLTYWPGREDKLMTDKNGDKRYYLTDVEHVTGTPIQQIENLLDNHFVDGQRFPILETVCELMKFLTKLEMSTIKKRVSKLSEVHEGLDFIIEQCMSQKRIST